MHPTGSEVYREKESPTLQGPVMRRSIYPAFRVRFWGCPGSEEGPEQPEQQPEEPVRRGQVRPAQVLTQPGPRAKTTSLWPEPPGPDPPDSSWPVQRARPTG